VARDRAAQRPREAAARKARADALAAQGIPRSTAYGHARSDEPTKRELDRVARERGETPGEARARLKAERTTADTVGAPKSRTTKAFSYGDGIVSIKTRSGADLLAVLRTARQDGRRVSVLGTRTVCGRGVFPGGRPHAFVDAGELLAELRAYLGRALTPSNVKRALSMLYPDPDGQDHPIGLVYVTVEAAGS
jgi:hypothetical protein